MQAQLVGSEKFMRCLTQFDHILNLKSRRMSYSTTMHAKGAEASDADIADQTERLSKRENSVVAVSEKTQHMETQTYGKRLAAHKLLQLLKPPRSTTRNFNKPEIRRMGSDAQLQKSHRTGTNQARTNFGSQGRLQVPRNANAIEPKEMQKTARQAFETRGMPINFVQRNILKVSKSQQKL